MKKTIKSKIDYKLIPLDQLNREQPLTIMQDMNDGYMVVLVGKWADKLEFDKERDWMTVEEFADFPALLNDQYDGDMEELETYLIGSKVVDLVSAGGMFRKYGELQASRLMDYFWEGQG